MADIKIDDDSLREGIKNLENVVLPRATKRALSDVANEVLRLSTFEVPHDIGILQGTGHVEPEGDAYIVGYNTRYAARLHEHPEYRFQKGRKGKYLEDPIKTNLPVFLKYAAESFQREAGFS